MLVANLPEVAINMAEWRKDSHNPKYSDEDFVFVVAAIVLLLEYEYFND